MFSSDPVMVMIRSLDPGNASSMTIWAPDWRLISMILDPPLPIIAPASCEHIEWCIIRRRIPGRVAQSVTCLTTDAYLTADPGVASSIPARSHTFVEIDHEIISTVILLPSADSFKKGCCQLQAKVCA